MATIEQAERINIEIEGWCSTATDIEKARLVVNWCEANKMNLTATPTQLHLAMMQMPYWNQGPSDFMSMAQALTAAGIGAKAEAEKLKEALRSIALYKGHSNHLKVACLLKEYAANALEPDDLVDTLM